MLTEEQNEAVQEKNAELIQIMDKHGFPPVGFMEETSTIIEKRIKYIQNASDRSRATKLYRDLDHLAGRRHSK